MRTLAVLMVVSFPALSAERLTATGTVVDDATKQPVAHATVLVHAAGVRTGYDQYQFAMGIRPRSSPSTIPRRARLPRH
ncbi:MAG: hypothetical protein JST93_22140 [Acidobacteria bacterium]|nr:hypothetical protein [Acidobacteriota bacterium]